MEEQPKLLPECDVVFLEGTTVTNGTVDELLNVPQSQEVVMLGPRPHVPAAFRYAHNCPGRFLVETWYKEKILRMSSSAASAISGIYDQKASCGLG